MKFILQKNVHNLIFIIQKLCFYYEYSTKYKFLFKNGDLFYTNVIEIENDNKFQYISLLSRPLPFKKASIEAEKTFVYYRKKIGIKGKTDKLNDNYLKTYDELIHYFFDSCSDSNISSDKLRNKIIEGEKLFDHPKVKEIQELFNDESENSEQNNGSKHKDNNVQEKQYLSCDQKLKKIISECKSDVEMTLWILFHGLFITKERVIEKYPVCYKYYSFTPNLIDFFRSGDKYFQKRLSKGTIFFNHPKYFNDPFDINCFTDVTGNIDKNSPKRNLFRVFCSTKQYDNILMWSHYGANHTGYCIEYSTESIIDCISSTLGDKNNKDNLVIVGNVLYNDKRKILSGKLFVTDLIRAAFKKSSEWKYEKEFRFVILNSKGFADSGYFGRGIPLSHVEVKKIYLGAEIRPGDESFVIQNNYNYIIKNMIKKMKLDKKGYKLKCRDL